MKNISTLFLLLFSLIVHAQNSLEQELKSRLVNLHEVAESNEYFAGFEQLKRDIGEARIVMLGEQSHGDATTFETKIKLVKYLHEEMGFEILAFESDIYSCDKAQSMMEQGHDVKDAMGKGIFGIWASVEELNPLYEYFKKTLSSENPMMLTGFDPQIMGRLASDYFSEDLSGYLAGFAEKDVYEEGVRELENFITKIRNFKKGRKKKATPNITFLDEMITLIEKNGNDERSRFWIQTLKSMKIFISDTLLKTNNRDQQMAENLIWLKERYPDKKIICWGATSHFLYNSDLIKFDRKLVEMVINDYYKDNALMGDYIKKKYGDDVFTIGFIAHEGKYGVLKYRTLSVPASNSLEYLIGQETGDNYFLSLKDLSLEDYLSRPLGHQFMTTDIAKVMDGVVFNRRMRPPVTDWEFMLYLTPENKMWEKKKERFIREYRLRKEARKKQKEASDEKPDRA